MSIEFVRRALTQAGEFEPDIRAMILLSAARVLAPSDPGEARHAFGEAIAIADALGPENFTTRQLLHREALRVGGAIDGEAALALLRRADKHGPSIEHAASALVRDLAQSGNERLAVEALEDETIPLLAAGTAVGLFKIAELKRRALIAAHQRWQRSRADPRMRPAIMDFYTPFSMHWRALGYDTLASDWVDEIVAAIAEERDYPISATYGAGIELKSMRSASLFTILNVIRAVKSPDYTAELLRRYSDVEAAAKQFPLGAESVRAAAEEAQRNAPLRPPGVAGMIGAGGSGTSMRGTVAALRGEPGAVAILLDEARESCARDTAPANPNSASRAFWPSTNAFRTAAYFAGKAGDKSGEVLSGIPDNAIRALASVELAAGLLGLPQQSTGMSEQRRPRHP